MTCSSAGVGRPSLAVEVSVTRLAGRGTARGGIVLDVAVSSIRSTFRPAPSLFCDRGRAEMGKSARFISSRPSRYQASHIGRLHGLHSGLARVPDSHTLRKSASRLLSRSRRLVCGFSRTVFLWLAQILRVSSTPLSSCHCIVQLSAEHAPSHGDGARGRTNMSRRMCPEARELGAAAAREPGSEMCLVARKPSSRSSQ